MPLVGYARVSTRDQNAALQPEALSKAECERIFEEPALGAQRDRQQLIAALDAVEEAAHCVCVSAVTLYRHFPAVRVASARSAQ